MKTSYFVSRLLRPVFALAVACTFATTTWAAESELTDVDTVTSIITIEDAQGTIDDVIVIEEGSQGVYISGDDASLTEMSGNITVTHTEAGNTSGLETYDGGYFGEMSGSITVNYTGASGYFATGVWVNGMEDDGTNSSAGTISGSVTLNGGAAYSYAVYINGDTFSTGCWNYPANNILKEIADTSVITVNTTSGSASGLKNAYSSVDYVGGTISATSETGYVFAVDNWGSIGTISADITAIQTGENASKYIIGIYNRSMGKVGTIDSVTSTINVTSVNTAVRGVYNIGIITELAADVTVKSEAGLAYAVYNLGCDISYNAGDGIGTMTGTYSASSTDNGARALLNYAEIVSVDATLIAYSENSTSHGVYNGTTTSWTAGTGSIGSIAGSISATSDNADAYGIRNYTAIGDVSADITVKADSTAYGIYNSSSGTGISDVSGAISCRSESDDALGILNFGTMSDVKSDITVSGATDAYGIYNKGTVSTISGDITAVATTGTAYGVYTTTQSSLSFGDDVSISATSMNESGDAYSLYSSAGSLSIESAGALTLVGDVKLDSSSSSSLTFAAGAVSLSEGSTITADSITIHKDASLSLVIAADDTITSSSLGGEGTLILSAGVALAADDYDFSSSDSFTSVSDSVKVLTYGGTLGENTFKVAATQTVTLDSTEAESGVTVTDNGRLEVSNDNTDTTIVMNFNTSGSDADAEATTRVNAVTTVTGETEIKTGLVVTESFKDFAESTTETSILASEAYYFDVDLSAGDSVQLVFDVGEGYDISQITVYHLADETISVDDEPVSLTEGTASWSDANEITDFTYDGQYLYVTVSGFSAYAYSVRAASAEIVPEPSTTTLGFLALAALCARRRRKAA